METLVSNVFPMAQLATVDANDADDDLVAFGRKPTDARFLSNDFVAITPEEPINPEIESLTFIIPKSSLPRYTSVNEILLSMCVSLETKKKSETEWKPVLDADNVAPSSFLPDIFWKQAEVYLGDTLVTPGHTFRHISAHLGRILGYHRTTFETYFGTELGNLKMKFLMFKVYIINCVLFFCVH